VIKEEMKRWLLILSLFLIPSFAVMAQEDDPVPEQEVEGKLQQRMREYIQDKLRLSKKESERFSPIFVRYFRDFAKTHRENRTDKLILQQKIIELRLRYRGEFREVIEEQKANRVFHFEDEFRKKAIEIIKDNRRERLGKPPLRNNRKAF
jgi:hypothetical protein